MRRLFRRGNPKYLAELRATDDKQVAMASQEPVLYAQQRYHDADHSGLREHEPWTTIRFLAERESEDLIRLAQHRNLCASTEAIVRERLLTVPRWRRAFLPESVVIHLTCDIAAVRAGDLGYE